MHPLGYTSIFYLQALGLLSLGDSLLQRRQGVLNILAVGVSDTDTHVAEADVLGSNLLVQTSCEDHTALQQTRKDVRCDQTLGQVHGGHAVSLALGLGSQLGQAQLGDSGLDAIRGRGVHGEALAHGAGGDLAKGSVQGVDKLGGRGGEVRGLLVLVVLHDGEPVGNRSVVGGGRGLARSRGLDGTAGTHHDAQTGRAANGLLAGGNHSIQVPFVECDLLRADTAHTVDNDQSVRADTADDLGNSLDVIEDTGGGIDVSDSDDLVGLLLQGLLDLLEGGAVANRGTKVCNLGAVGLQAVAERVTEVAGVHDEGVFALLDQVGRNQIPTQGTTAGNDEGLRGGVGGLEQLAGEGQGLAEDINEAGSYMALTNTEGSGQLIYTGENIG